MTFEQAMQGKLHANMDMVAFNQEHASMYDERAVIKGFLESLEESGIVLTFFENVDDDRVILDSNKLLDDYIGE